MKPGQPRPGEDSYGVAELGRGTIRKSKVDLNDLLFYRLNQLFRKFYYLYYIVEVSNQSVIINEKHIKQN